MGEEGRIFEMCIVRPVRVERTNRCARDFCDVNRNGACGVLDMATTCSLAVPTRLVK